jgi:hypothetical protein
MYFITMENFLNVVLISLIERKANANIATFNAVFSMAKQENKINPIKTLRNRYRLVVMNDDTYEEVVTFKLSRKSVYIALSSLFVMLVVLSVALLMYTPLKYYIPGYGTRQGVTELQLLKLRTDSLENAINNKQQYLDALQKALAGDTKALRDTTPLSIQKTDISND